MDMIWCFDEVFEKHKVAWTKWYSWFLLYIMIRYLHWNLDKGLCVIRCAHLQSSNSAHSFTWTGNLKKPILLLSGFWEVGGKQRTWRRPTWSQGEHVKRCADSNLSQDRTRALEGNNATRCTTKPPTYYIFSFRMKYLWYLWFFFDIFFCCWKNLLNTKLSLIW